MKNATYIAPSLLGASPSHLRLRARVLLLAAVLLPFLFSSGGKAFADSATWNLNPTSGDWNTAANWTPPTVPDGPADVAMFGLSNRTSVVLNESVRLNQIVFEAGASPFTITSAATPSPFAHFNITGTGMINNSGINQTFVTQVAEGVLGIGVIDFFNNATAGSSITYINSGSSSGSTAGGTTEFFDSSTAGNATFINEGGSAFAAWGGRIYFFESASANAATIDNQGVEGLGTLGGFIAFNDNSTADQCTITNGSAADIFFFGGTAAQGTFINQGGDASHPSGGFIELAGLTRTDAGSGLFINHGGTASGAAGGLMIVVDSNAKTATLVANGGSGGGEGAQIQFNGFAEGAMARVQVFGNGNLDISGLNSQGTTIGTLEGDGLVFLGSRELSPGSNNLDSVFSGTIADGGFFGGTGGRLVKIGNGLLTLTGSNTYSGGTTMSAGGLVINNTTGSGTGTGAVQVNAGILAGNGTISGAVTVGTGSGTGAFLTPGMGASKATTLIIQSALTFKADATYTCRLNTKKTKADQLIANGVTIENGARFAFKVTGDEQLRTGKTATVISNTSATPISGTFANLPDASTFTVGPNTFQVSYEGGDGNDLTLMVVPQPSK